MTTMSEQDTYDALLASREALMQSVIDLSVRLAAQRRLCAALALQAEGATGVCAERQVRLAAHAAARGQTIGELFDEALIAWLATQAPAPVELRPAA